MCCLIIRQMGWRCGFHLCIADVDVIVACSSVCMMVRHFIHDTSEDTHFASTVPNGFEAFNRLPSL